MWNTSEGSCLIDQSGFKILLNLHQKSKVTFEHRWKCQRCRIETTATDEACVGAREGLLCVTVARLCLQKQMEAHCWTAPGASPPQSCTHTSSGLFPTAGVALFYETR